MSATAAGSDDDDVSGSSRLPRSAIESVHGVSPPGSDDDGDDDLIVSWSSSQLPRPAMLFASWILASNGHMARRLGAASPAQQRCMLFTASGRTSAQQRALDGQTSTIWPLPLIGEANESIVFDLMGKGELRRMN
eukprot:scaffold253520_cov20-Tisochrysis_lutea.AAC.2